MAGVKEIKARIEGVSETRKITNAMYLVASTKLRHAREALSHTLPYFDAMRRETGGIFRSANLSESRYFVSEDGSVPKEGVCGVLVITADKGLAGSYNMNAIRRTEEILSEQPDARLFVVGEFGRRHFQMRRIPFERDFYYTAQDPTLDRARTICTRLLDLYDRGELNEIIAVYTDMQSSLSSTAQKTRLLPLERAILTTGGTGEQEARFAFYPSTETVVASIMRSYISGFFYSAMVDSFCCEQNARVTAMDSAGRNADELLSTLSLQLNRERQSAITQEITEISAGARAQKNKREVSS